MQKENLGGIAKKLVVPKKGILAADESTKTIKKRFAEAGVESTEEARRFYRELLFTAPGLEEYISGVIMYDETIRQATSEGVSFVEILRGQGIVPGIKVDLGTKPMANSPEESYTEGLAGLADRLKEYYKLGARFAKWRAVFKISDKLPSHECIETNAKILAEYAMVCQQENFVPIVEPEVLMAGEHTIDRCYEVTGEVLRQVFVKLKDRQVDLEAMLLKPNMIIAGEESDEESLPPEVAVKTVECLSANVPKEAPGIVFLSGGQSEKQACENLNAINLATQDLPWELSFSFGRALQKSALRAWAGDNNNLKAVQEAFLHRARLVSLAREGKYSQDMELD